MTDSSSSRRRASVVVKTIAGENKTFFRNTVILCFRNNDSM